MKIPKSILLGASPIISILLVWQIVSTQHIISPVILPPVSKIFVALYVSLTGGNAQYALPKNFLFTMERMIFGYLLAAVVAIPLGLLIGSSKKVHRLLEPTIEIFRPMPTVALVPFFILAFGINTQMDIFFVAFGCVWPILVNTIDGVRNIDPLFFDVAKSFRKRARKVMIRVTLPGASPYIASGLRISMLLALLLTVVIEMTSGGVNGLGYSTIFAQQTLNITMLYAEIFFIAIIGFCLNFLFVKAENRLMSWHKKYMKIAAQTGP